MTGADYVIDFLQKKNVDTVFGYPGAAILELYDSLGNSKIRHILVRHEQGAVFAASGYAKMSGRAGVCIATSGPGAVNLTTGIADAYLDSVPLIIITGQVDTVSIGRDAFQEADIMGITIPITKHNYLVKHGTDLRRVLEEAWQIATAGRRGPVLIDIAKDVFIEDIDCDIPFNVALPRCRDNEYRLSEQIPAIKEAIESCHRPLILAGGGVVAACASGKLGQYAQKSGIPVVTTLMGMGIVMGDGVNLLGMTGMYGNRAAVTALSQCDLLIAVGTRFSDRTIPDFNMFARSRMIIHCDIDPAEINKNLTADIAAVCGADEFFDALYELDISYNSDSYGIWNNQLAVLKAAHVIQLHEKRLSNWEIMRILNGFGIKRRDMVYVSDVGDFQTHAAREIEPQFERGFITSGGLGTMGCGLPSAIGATYAADACVKNIILMCGDGGFQMSIQELSTLKSARLPVKIFIFDNGALRMIKNAQNKCFNGRYVDSILNDNPDFELIGKAYGIKTCRLDVSRRYTLESDIGNILDAEQHMLVHCCV